MRCPAGFLFRTAISIELGDDSKPPNPLDLQWPSSAATLRTKSSVISQPSEYLLLERRQPTVLDRAIEASLVLRRRALELEQKRPVDLLDIDPPVLDRLEGVGQLDQLARGASGSAKGRGSVNFMCSPCAR
jgi:hypothetical protein